MKKMLCMIIAIALCFPVFSGCSVDKRQQTVELTKDNYGKYIELSMLTQDVPADSDAPLKCVVSGALNYAFYEDVVLTFVVSHYKETATEVSTHNSYEIEIMLNAAGNAEFEISPSGFVVMQYGKGHNYKESIIELSGHNRHIDLLSVTGTVSYTL